VVESAQVLRAARLAAGLSQPELARRAGVAQSVISTYESGKREPSVPTLRRLVEATGHHLTLDVERTDSSVRGLPNSALARRLRQRRTALLRAVQNAGAANLRVFGSVARGEDTPDSDIDLLVDMPGGAGLFALQSLEGELQRILGVDVDLAPVDSLKPRVRAEAERDAIVV
jgi:predicted nucleotidyltransferase/DNA-binding XRE family transcriptional regulator